MTQDDPSGLRADVRPEHRRRGALGRHLAAGRSRARPRRLRRREPARRRQDPARRPRADAGLRQRDGLARHAALQCAADRPGARHRQGRHRHQGGPHRGRRQGGQPGDHGRGGQEPHLRRGNHGARLGGPDRDPRRHRRARALRLRRALPACRLLRHHHDDRRLARPHHRRHRLRRRLERRQDAAGGRAVAAQLRLPRPRQLVAAAIAARSDRGRLLRTQDPRGLGRDARGHRHLPRCRRRARLPGCSSTPTP